MQLKPILCGILTAASYLLASAPSATADGYTATSVVDPSGPASTACKTPPPKVTPATASKPEEQNLDTNLQDQEKLKIELAALRGQNEELRSMYFDLLNRFLSSRAMNSVATSSALLGSSNDQAKADPSAETTESGTKIQPTQELSPFKSPDGNFSVVMPPPLQQKDIPVDYGMKHLYGSQTNHPQVQYWIWYNEHKDSSDPRDLVSDFCVVFMHDPQMNGFVCSGSPRHFKINGHPATEYVVGSLQKVGRIVFCATQNRSYAFCAYVPTGDGDPKALDSFFKSIWIR